MFQIVSSIILAWAFVIPVFRSSVAIMCAVWFLFPLVVPVCIVFWMQSFSMGILIISVGVWSSLLLLPLSFNVFQISGIRVLSILTGLIVWISYRVAYWFFSGSRFLSRNVHHFFVSWCFPSGAFTRLPILPGWMWSCFGNTSWPQEYALASVRAILFG